MPSMRRKKSAVVFQSHDSADSRADNGMPSTRASMLMRYGAPSVVRGGTLNPQLPPTTDVTPWRIEGLSVGSHSTCAS